jgi:F0F1-type ATP synthase membrane subunit c/vacuolar-type H+-ATPase subunit K
MKKLTFVIAAILSSAPAFAQEAAAHAASAGVTDHGLFALGAALALGIAALGGGLAQGKIGASAMEGLARNPQARDSIFVPMIIALVFVETLVLFTFALSFLLQAKA